MLDVFLTVDVEVWCDGWDDIDTKFPDAFQRYIYGPTSRGDYGLPYQCKQLQENGLTGIFFVDPLFHPVRVRAIVGNYRSGSRGRS